MFVGRDSPALCNLAVNRAEGIGSGFGIGVNKYKVTTDMVFHRE